MSTEPLCGFCETLFWKLWFQQFESWRSKYLSYMFLMRFTMFFSMCLIFFSFYENNLSVDPVTSLGQILGPTARKYSTLLYFYIDENIETLLPWNWEQTATNKCEPYSHSRACWLYSLPTRVSLCARCVVYNEMVHASLHFVIHLTDMCFKRKKWVPSA